MSEVRETRAPVAVAILLGAALTSTAIAQLAPRAGYVFPPGGRAGTTVEVRLGGFDFTRDMQYFVHDERLAWEVRGELSGFYVPPPPYWFGPKGRSSRCRSPEKYPPRSVFRPTCPRGPCTGKSPTPTGSVRPPSS